MDQHQRPVLWVPGPISCGLSLVLLGLARSQRDGDVLTLSAFLSCRDTFIVTLGNAITSILAGFAIFSVLGYMSQELGVPVDKVAKAGQTET